MANDVTIIVSAVDPSFLLVATLLYVINHKTAEYTLVNGDITHQKQQNIRKIVIFRPIRSTEH